MTAKARKVLNDCRYAHELLELEENTGKFRLLWVSCSSLLRAVGHVLHKVDAESNTHLKRAIEEMVEKSRQKRRPTSDILQLH